MVLYGVYGMYDPLGFGKLYILYCMLISSQKGGQHAIEMVCHES